MKLLSKLFLMVLLSSVVLACSLSSGTKETKNKDVGGIINFNIKNDFNSRLLQPDYDLIPASYRLVGLGPSGATFDFEVNDSEAKIEFLRFGEWNVSVEVRNAAGEIFARGSGSTIINVGEESTLEITTSLLDGNGSLDLTFTWPDSEVQNASPTARLIADDGTQIILTLNDAGVNSGLNTRTVSTGNTLSAGYYSLIIQVTDLGASGTQNHIALGAVEVVRVLENQNTQGTLNLTGVIGQGLTAFSIITDLDEIIDVSMANSDQLPTTFDFESNTTFTVNAQVPVNDVDSGSLTYVWYLNGLMIGTGSSTTINSANSPFSTNVYGMYIPGTYRLDLVAFNNDGSRGGSTTFNFSVTGNAASIVTQERGSVVGVVGFLDESPNSSNFVPLSGVTVKSGNRQVISGADGSFTLSGVAAGRSVVSFISPDYLENHKTVTVEANATTDIQTTYMLVQEIFTMNSASGGSYSLGDGKGGVTFQPNSIADANGNIYNGTVSVKTNAINPETDGFFDLFPGDFKGVTVSGDVTEIVSYGVITVVMEDSNGNPLNLANGSTAEISVAVSDPATAPPTMPLWYFDESTGNWVEDGVATLIGNMYVGSVTHFTSWNFDYPIPTEENERFAFGTLSGRVVDQSGAGVANAQLVFTSLSGLAWETTETSDANGNFSNIRVYVSRSDTSPLYSVFAIKDGLRSSRVLIELNNRTVSNIEVEIATPVINITVDAQKGSDTRLVENGGAALRFGNMDSFYIIYLRNQDADGLSVDGITLSGSDQFRIISGSNETGLVSPSSFKRIIVGFTYVANNNSVTGQLLVTSNSVTNSSYVINLEGGSDPTQSLSQTTSFPVTSSYTGYIYRDEQGTVTANNTWNETEAIITESATGTFRACAGFDLSTIPSNATITAATLRFTSSSHNGLNIYEGRQEEVILASHFDALNTTGLTDGVVTVGNNGVFNAAGLAVIDSHKGVALPIMFYNNDNSYGFIDLTSFILDVTYSY